MQRKELKGVNLEAHLRDVDELKRTARRLRDGWIRIPPFVLNNTPHPMEPYHSGSIVLRVMVPPNRVRKMKELAAKLNKLRQEGGTHDR